HTTYSEHDIVTVTGVDDDNAGPSSQAVASADATVLQAPPLAITNSSLCTFDTNTGLAEKQFHRLLTQNSQTFPKYQDNSTNPGQFYWNVNVGGKQGQVVHVKLTVPWPFVTQGAQPIHVYDGVTLKDIGGGNFCFVPGNEIGTIQQYVVLSEYHVALG